MVRVLYDAEADALAVEFNPTGRSARMVRVAPGVNVDLDAKGRLVTLEVLGASEHVSRAELEQLPTPQELLTLTEAARESGLSSNTLRTQIRNGRLAAVKRGRDWLVDVTALWNYLESRDARGRPAAKHRGRRDRKVVAHA